MLPTRNWRTAAGVILMLFALGGCATSGVTTPSQNDPFESVNRSILEFNLESDRVLLKPVASAYARWIPGPVRTGVNNFFSNLWEPMTIVNDLLQGKLGHAGRDTARFVINSTLGFWEFWTWQVKWICLAAGKILDRHWRFGGCRPAPTWCYLSSGPAI